MQKEYIKFYCDICKKEVPDGKSLRTVIIPIRHFESTDYQGFGRWAEKPRLAKLDVCDECLEGIQKAISDNFAFIYSEDYSSEITVELRERRKDEETER